MGKKLFQYINRHINYHEFEKLYVAGIGILWEKIAAWYIWKEPQFNGKTVWETYEIEGSHGNRISLYTLHIAP